MAAHIITGPIDASDYKTYIFPILFFKRINDVYQEEFAAAMQLYGDSVLASSTEQHRIQIPEGCRWHDVLATTRDVGSLAECFPLRGDRKPAFIRHIRRCALDQ